MILYFGRWASHGESLEASCHSTVERTHNVVPRSARLMMRSKRKKRGLVSEELGNLLPDVRCQMSTLLPRLHSLD